MIDDLRGLRDGQRLDADVCIIGAGAAGIAIARRLSASRLRTVVLESGGLEFEPDVQALTAARAVGLPLRLLDANRLTSPEAGRFRVFGGSTLGWVGICTPLGASDFEPREWIDDSGWPFSKEELDQWYAQAQVMCGLDSEPFGEDGVSKLGARAPNVDQDILRPHVWQFAWARRFGEMYRAELGDASNVRVLLHANVTNLQVDRTASAVLHVDASAVRGPGIVVHARAFVLATGGIENARILLASNRVAHQGLGNAYDLVGRYFTEHLRCHVGVLFPLDPASFEAVFDYHWMEGSERGRLGFTLSPAMQKRLGVGHAAVYLVRPPLFLDYWPEARQLADAGDVAPSPREGGLLSAVDVVMDAEQVPNRKSRVTLDDDCDALGVPRACIDWRLGEQDLRTLGRSAGAFGAELERHGLARFRLDKWLAEPTSDWASHVHDVYHHAGTTRMANHPAKGVTDPACRVHGIANLFVAGSSVFPTAGHANPTLTILALALRLADRLIADLA